MGLGIEIKSYDIYLFILKNTTQMVPKSAKSNSVQYCPECQKACISIYQSSHFLIASIHNKHQEEKYSNTKCMYLHVVNYTLCPSLFVKSYSLHYQLCQSNPYTLRHVSMRHFYSFAIQLIAI